MNNTALISKGQIKTRDTRDDTDKDVDRLKKKKNSKTNKKTFLQSKTETWPWSLDFSSLQNSLLVEIPPYRNQRLSTPVHVNFYVCNGKRKRSQYQRFTYVPAGGKALLLRYIHVQGCCDLTSRSLKVGGCEEKDN